MCSESAEEAKFATLQEYVPESKEERSVGTVCLPLITLGVPELISTMA